MDYRKEVLFYSEALCCDRKSAYLVVKFIEFINGFCVSSVNPWSKNGLVRVYFDFYSQNKMPFHKMVNKSWFCTKNIEIMCSNLYSGNIPCRNLSRSHFSGAKTRHSFNRIIEGFDFEKTSWAIGS